jgi:hypothetical protein
MQGSGVHSNISNRKASSADLFSRSAALPPDRSRGPRTYRTGPRCQLFPPRRDSQRVIAAYCFLPTAVLKPAAKVWHNPVLRN